MPDPRGPGRFHYAGLAGSGMSALAQFQVMSGGRASGSDRAFDLGERVPARALLERLGIAVHPQDGSGVKDDCAALVVSTAVEEQVPDVAVARALDLPILHRSALLAHFVASHRSLAVAGTSGKSTAVAMIFEMLRACGRGPSVITGGDLLALQRQGLWGNAFHGDSDLLVVEADESDGSLVHYRPAIGVVINLQRDHKEMAEVAAMFGTLRRHTREAFVVGEDPSLAAIAEGATVFGFGPRAEIRGEAVRLGPADSTFEVRGVPFRLPTPGRHNVENALAAVATCERLGVPLAGMARALERFMGVARRFQSLGSARGVEVVDDFAHNPAKLAAAIATARLRVAAGAGVGPGREEPAGAAGGRVLAIYQPHGYGPTRFLRRDFVETFSSSLGGADRLWLLEIFYAGGTARRDFSASDIVAEITARGTAAEFAATRRELVERVAREARPGDLVLVMGARDPSLTELARQILDTLGHA